MGLIEEAIGVVDGWYRSLETYEDQLPAKGSIAAALHILNRLRGNYDLDIASHVSGGEAQIMGLSGAAVKRVLQEFGETRPLSSIGGRSNRGARGDIARLLHAMRGLSLDRMPAQDRECVLREMQRHVVETYVPLYFAAKRVKALFDPNASMVQCIEAILENARQNNKAGAVAEYLVGAKLALRFPNKTIRNKRFSVSDAQSGFAGDFEVGTTAFHVTVAPAPELYERLRSNLESGLRVYLLVAKSQVVGVEQNAAAAVGPGKITIASIESFVATNIDELAEFDGRKLKSGLRRLLETYNKRVDEVELDKSLLIDIPPNLD